MTDEDDILAAEYALGLLSPGDAAATEARMRTDGPLSLRVAWWRDQLGLLAEEGSVEPAMHVWPAIAAQLGANDNVVDAARPWKWATGGLAAIAAMLLAYIATSPVYITHIESPAPPMPMVAALSGEGGNVVAVSYDGTTGRIMIAPTTLEPGKGDAELWIIPEGGKPVSLGIMDAKASDAHMVSIPKRAMLKPGATFAITQEVKGGSPDGDPHGPIIASGKIIRV